MRDNLKKYLETLGNPGRKVSDSSEDDILKLVRNVFPENLMKAENISVPAMSDDAAVINTELIGKDYELVITSDAVVEGADFLFDWMPSFDLGIKSLAVNLSDLAAMGAEPIGMIAVVGVNRDFPFQQLESFIKGLAEIATKYNVLLLGGDLSESENFFVNITLLGRVPKNKALRRSDVQEGDIIAVTGYPGEAKAGFEIISGKAGNVRSEERIFTQRFLRPQPRIEEGYILRDSGCVRGCIDLSDGLSKDLERIANLNNLKAIIDSADIPASDTLKNFWKRRNRDYIEMTIIGGEDFELLFSTPSDKFKALKEKVESVTGITITRIGEWKKGKGVSLLTSDNQEKEITGLGFDHFNRKSG